MGRWKNVEWDLPEGANNPYNPKSWDDVRTALLMDIRDELQKLNRVFECPNFVAIPRILNRISANTAKPKRKKKGKK